MSVRLYAVLKKMLTIKAYYSGATTATLGFEIMQFDAILMLPFILYYRSLLRYTNADLKICQYLRLHMKIIC